MPVKPKLTFVPGKTYTYSGTEGVFSVIAGEILEGDGISPNSGASLTYSDSAPTSGSGKDGDIHIDKTNFKIYTRTSGSWDAGSLFKGANGSNGSNGNDGAPGANGKSVHFGNGSPSAGLGGDLDVYLDLTDFKVHTKTSGSWSAGSVFKGSTGSTGAAGTNGKSIKWGNGAPSGSPGADDDLYFDITNFHVYPKSGGSWDAANKQLFKGATGASGAAGSKGDTGTAGNTVLQGSGTPSSGAGSDGDTFLDVTNHVIYKKAAGSWSAQGASFKGATGPGLVKYSTGLDSDTYLSTGGTQSSATTSASTGYPATLYFTDTMEDLGSAVTPASIHYKKNVSDLANAGAGSLTGTKFTISTAGRYKVDFYVTFTITAATSSANSVDINAAIRGSSDGGTTVGVLTSTSATVTTASTSPVSTTLSLSKTQYFKSGSIVYFTASRGASTINTTVAVNAVTKTDDGDDTFVILQKL